MFSNNGIAVFVFILQKIEMAGDKNIHDQMILLDYKVKVLSLNLFYRSHISPSSRKSNQSAATT